LNFLFWNCTDDYAESYGNGDGGDNGGRWIIIALSTKCHYILNQQL